MVLAADSRSLAPRRFSTTALLLAVLASPARTQVPEDRRDAFALDAGWLRTSGFVQVREGPPGGPGEGTRLNLRDLGLSSGETIALNWTRLLSRDSSLEIALRWNVLTGDGRFARDVQFNSVTYAAGTRIGSAAELGDVSLRWRRDLLDLPRDGRLGLLAGGSLTMLNFVTHGRIAATSSGHDQSEDFWKQALPLPSLGLGLRQPLAPDLDLLALATGFRAIRWNSLRKEGGTVFLSEDDFEASALLDWRCARRADLRLGWRWYYVHLLETSREDGNEFLLRGTGPFVALQWRF